MRLKNSISQTLSSKLKLSFRPQRPKSRKSERRKKLTLKFHGDGYFLIANFSVEEMRLRRTLVEHAAEVVARIVDDVEELEIPETLKEVVGEKIRDHEWVAL